VYTPEQRDALRTELLAASHADPRITGGAITGSASVGLEDRWSDIDLACLRLGLPAAQGRGMDGLPNDVTAPLEDALVPHLVTNELARAFRVALAGLLREVQRVDEDLAERLRDVLMELGG